MTAVKPVGTPYKAYQGYSAAKYYDKQLPAHGGNYTSPNNGLRIYQESSKAPGSTLKYTAYVPSQQVTLGPSIASQAKDTAKPQEEEDSSDYAEEQGLWSPYSPLARKEHSTTFKALPRLKLR